MFAILVFVITMPRMKDYAYMVAIPSVLFAVHEFDWNRIPRWVLVLPLVLVPPRAEWPWLFDGIFDLFWSYYPLFFAGLFWFFYVQRSLAAQTAK
jgi:hypothetical protein